MKSYNHLKKYTVTAIAYLYAMLFTYAAFSKLFDFENFRVQLGQSPLLSAFASWIAFVVPISEFVIAYLVVSIRHRFVGLFCCYVLMAMFTAYIYIILNYSAFVPCSCGGILEKMTWNQHLIFNLAFLFLAFIGILIAPITSEYNFKKFHA